MKRVLLWSGVLALLVVLIANCARRDRMEILYFYAVACRSCEESRRLLSNAGILASFARRDLQVKVAMHDLFRSEKDADAFIDAIDRYQVPTERQRLPLLIVNGVPYSGSEDVEQAIAAMVAAPPQERRSALTGPEEE